MTEDERAAYERGLAHGRLEVSAQAWDQQDSRISHEILTRDHEIARLKEELLAQADVIWLEGCEFAWEYEVCPWRRFADAWLYIGQAAEHDNQTIELLAQLEVRALIHWCNGYMDAIENARLFQFADAWLYIGLAYQEDCFGRFFDNDKRHRPATIPPRKV